MLLAQSPSATFSEIAAAAGVSRSTLYRRSADRDELLAALERRPQAAGVAERAGRRCPRGGSGADGRSNSTRSKCSTSGAAGAPRTSSWPRLERIAEVPIALYLLDIDGTHLLRLAGSLAPRRASSLPRSRSAPSSTRTASPSCALGSGDFPGTEAFPLWLRGRAIGVFVAFGRPHASLTCRDGSPGGRCDHLGGPLHRRVRSEPSGASSPRPLPRSNRACCHHESPGSAAARSPATSYRATRWPATGSTSIENPDGVWVALADGARRRQHAPRPVAPSHWGAPRQPPQRGLRSAKHSWSCIRRCVSCPARARR